MTLKLPQETVFYQIEKGLKRYRKLAQLTIDQTGYEVSVNQIILLINLREKPNATQVELSELIFKDVASITRMVELLVKNNFITRIESKLDRRKKDLHLTAKGNRMLDEIMPCIQQYRALALAGFSEPEVHTLSTLLSRLITNCESAIDQPE